MAKNTEAKVDSTPTDDSTATDSRTEEQLLADIVRNSEFTENEESLPTEQVPELDTEETDEDPESEESETEEVEEEVESEEEETEGEDDDQESSTEEPEVYTTNDLDLDAKVSVKIDGKETAVSFGDLIKGYSTEQHLSNKGRELGDARKKLEEEYSSRVAELDNMGKLSSQILYNEEQKHAKSYHDIEAKIEKARENGDTYELGELKDKREQLQKQYWDARRNREKLSEDIKTQVQAENQKNWQAQLDNFSKTIPTMIPDFNEKTAKAIREFAVKEGISEELLDSVVDPKIVKFVDDYRRLKEGVSKGKAKRKVIATRRVPNKKAKTKSQKEIDEASMLRQRAFDPDSSEEDQMAFLRDYAEQSLTNNA